LADRKKRRSLEQTECNSNKHRVSICTGLGRYKYKIWCFFILYYCRKAWSGKCWK